MIDLPRAVGSWVTRLVALVALFMWELVLANLRVAFDVLTPRARMHPGITAVPLAAKSDWEITLFANLITLTPGTLSLDVSDDRRVLYVHAIYLGNPRAFSWKLKRMFERRVVELLL